jgi:hypothetical protein
MIGRAHILLLVPLATLAAVAASCSKGSPATGSSGAGGAADAGAEASYGPPFTIPGFNDVRIGSDSTKPNFQKAEVDVDLSGGPFSTATLVVDLGTTCFPFSNWKTDPPPAGQNWPADCDAFDRNFELSLDNPVNMGDPPGIELVRAITPFGGPMHLEIDITDVANGLTGKHHLQVLIPTYSDPAGMVSGSNGGWNVTSNIQVTPGPPPHQVLAVIPLYYASQTTQASPPPISFTVPAGTVSSRLEWRATGHGGANPGPGCIGPAEEFCHRKHTLTIDGQPLATIDPWRTDCAKECTLQHYGPPDGGFDYCDKDPCGDPTSVMASRANWCPGTVTPPFTWDAKPLDSAGMHQLSWTISVLEMGGQWRLSAVYFAFAN